MTSLGEPSEYTVPTLLTERLALRTWRPADVVDYIEMNRNPDMAAYTSASTAEAAIWSMFAFQIGHWALRGYGMWVLEDRQSGKFVGRGGLYEEWGWPGLEVAWTVRRDLWGRGLATEAGAAALGFAFDTVGRDRVISLIHPDNAASIRVAEKLGLTHSHRERVHGQTQAIYAITRAEWEARTTA
jgi:RimJ/RimL family protein N-acetyltransferase